MYVVPVCHRFFAKAAVRRIGGTWLCNLHTYNMMQKGVEKGGERERDCTFLFALMVCTIDNVLRSTFLDA